MTDTTAARRALLDILLDRIERGALLDNERDLLRPLVAAEMADADRAEQAEDLLHIAQETSNRAESIVYRLRQAVREARAAARPRSELAGMVDQMTAILDTPADDEPTPGDGPSPAVVRAELDAAQAVVARVRAKVAEWRDWNERETAWAVRDIEQAISNEPEPGPSPMPDDGPPTPVLDALRTGQPITVTRCSPLVNAYCPGHTDGSQCDRAPSSPITPAATPDWTTPADAPSEPQQ